MLQPLVMTLLSTATVWASVGERKPGVKAGDWATFKHITISSTNNPEITGNLSITKTLVGRYISRLSILAVDGTEISYAYYSPMGIFNNTFDIAVLQGFSAFISANLSLGDKLNITPECNLIINSTLRRVYQCVEREVNYVNVRHNETMYGWYEEESTEGYWDRKTGIVCEGKYNRYISNEFFNNYSTHSFLLETNMWQCSEHLPTDLNRDCFVGIDDLVICAEAFGSDPLTFADRWNPVCDVDGDGHVGIKDAVTIAKDFGSCAVHPGCGA